MGVRKLVDIQRDSTSRRERWYAVTDKGVMWGGSREIVERKIIRLGAKKKVWEKASGTKKHTPDPDPSCELPF